MIGDCEAWRREAPRVKEHPEDADFEEFSNAFLAHIAVCERCQRDREEYYERCGAIGRLSAEVARDMRADGWDAPIDEPTIHFVATHVLRVAERWKIVKVDESMLEVRSEGARRRASAVEKA